MLGALGSVALGSCGGVVFASFVVDGSNIAQYRGSNWEMASTAPAPPPEWVREAAMEISDAGFTPDTADGYSDALH
jgi:hypothetical protein